jgi:hypothetical protein
MSNANSASTGPATFATFVDRCESALASFRDQFDETSRNRGVRRDREIRTEWDRLSDAVERTIPQYEAMLPIFSAWHAFVTNLNAMPSSLRDIAADDYTRAIKPLVESGHEVLRTYGERWAELSITRREAWLAWDASNFRDANRNALRDAWNASDRARDDFIRASRPDMNNTADVLGVNLRDGDFNLTRFISDVQSVVFGKLIEDTFNDLFR